MSSNKAGKKRANPRDEDEAMLDSQVAAADSSDEEDEDEDEDEDQESSDDGEEIVEGDEGEEEGEEPTAMDGCNAQVEGRLWRAGDTLAEGETLEFDSAAYEMLHRMHTDWPCLTFDVVQDGLGQQRTKFPLTAYAVAGTQAERPEQNKILCMKLSDLVRTKHDDEQDIDDDSDDEGAPTPKPNPSPSRSRSPSPNPNPRAVAPNPNSRA